MLPLQSLYMQIKSINSKDVILIRNTVLCYAVWYFSAIRRAMKWHRFPCYCVRRWKWKVKLCTVQGKDAHSSGISRIRWVSFIAFPSCTRFTGWCNWKIMLRWISYICTVGSWISVSRDQQFTSLAVSCKFLELKISVTCLTFSASLLFS